MDEKIKIKLAQALTSEETAIIPYLPYLLQDFWELGSSPQDMLYTIRKHVPLDKNTSILDLACGKGAVSVLLAKELGVRVKGVDIMPEFIKYAKYKAKEHGVSHLCDFKVEDVNLTIKKERNYDCVIFGAVGDILGNYQETVTGLLPTVKNGGYLLIDDAYVAEHSTNNQLLYQKSYPTLDEWSICFDHAGLNIITCMRYSDPDPDTIEKEMRWITARADELIEKYPAKRILFEQYVISQRNEYTDLQQNLTGAVWLLQKTREEKQR